MNIQRYTSVYRALECDQFGRTCNLISQWCDFKKSEVALVRPAVREKKKSPKKQLVTNLATSWTNFSESLWSLVRPCQSTIMGWACTELRHSDRNLRTAWFEKVDFKMGIKKHWVDFYYYRMNVNTQFQHTFLFKQHVKWILHLMTLLKLSK